MNIEIASQIQLMADSLDNYRRLIDTIHSRTIDSKLLSRLHIAKENLEMTVKVLEITAKEMGHDNSL